MSAVRSSVEFSLQPIFMFSQALNNDFSKPIELKMDYKPIDESNGE
jgi:hypothetical protein